MQDAGVFQRQRSGGTAALFDASAGTFESGHATKSFAMLRKTTSRSLFPVEDGDDSERKGSKQVVAGEPLSMSIFLGSRCTKVHFVRHAEGFHNVVTREAGRLGHEVALRAAEEARQKALSGGCDPVQAEERAKAVLNKTLRDEENRPVHFATVGAEQYTDAQLTNAGRNQCYALRGKIDRNQLVTPLDRLHVDLVVVSPLRRCLETADIIFGPGRTKDRPDLLPFLVHDLCRERHGEFYCDKRRSLSENREDERWSDWDWDTQEKTWPSGTMEFRDEDEAWHPERETEEMVLKRAMKFLQWLSARPEKEVVVVTHSSFLKNLFKVFGGESSKDDQDVLRAVPANCELRTVVLCHHGG